MLRTAHELEHPFSATPRKGKARSAVPVIVDYNTAAALPATLDTDTRAPVRTKPETPAPITATAEVGLAIVTTMMCVRSVSLSPTVLGDGCRG